MPSKRRKLQPLSSADTKSSVSLVSLFARQQSRCDHSQNTEVGEQQQTAGQSTRLSEVVNRRRFVNRLSLSERRKRLCASDAVIDVNDNADQHSTTHISTSSCMFDAAGDTHHDLLPEASLISPDIVSSTTAACGSQQTCIDDDDNSTSVTDSSPSLLSANDVRVPYYLENFLLILDSVFSDPFYAQLFNDDDLSALKTFKTLNGI